MKNAVGDLHGSEVRRKSCKTYDDKTRKIRRDWEAISTAMVKGYSKV
jgi:hypothetical protein